MNKIAYLEGYLMKAAANYGGKISDLIGVNKRVLRDGAIGLDSGRSLFTDIAGNSAKATAYRDMLRNRFKGIPEELLNQHINDVGKLDINRDVARHQLSELQKNISRDYRRIVKPTMEVRDAANNKLLNEIKAQHSAELGNVRSQHAQDIDALNGTNAKNMEAMKQAHKKEMDLLRKQHADAIAAGDAETAAAIEKAIEENKPSRMATWGIPLGAAGLGLGTGYVAAS